MVLLPGRLDHGDLAQRHGCRINSALVYRKVRGPVTHVRECGYRAGVEEGVRGDFAGYVGDGGWSEKLLR